jgi:hypothetical protein
VNKTDKNIQIIVDLTGPIIDISQISDYRSISAVRYLNEKEIANILNHLHPGGRGWDGDDIIKRIIEVLRSKSRVSILDKEVVEILCAVKKFAEVKIISSVPNPAFFVEAKSLIITYSEYISKRNNVNNFNPDYFSFEDNDFVLIGKNEKGDSRQYKTLKEYLVSLNDNGEKYRI